MIYHNSKELEYRSPFGAVEIGRGVRLRARSDADALFCLRRDEPGEEFVLPMQKDGEFFSCELETKEAGLIFYSFFRDSENGRESSPEYQISVYKLRLAPKWYKEAIVYQIFPDRFARASDFSEAEAAELLAGTHKNGPLRRICSDWRKPPSYEKNPDGSIRVWDFYGGSLKGIEEKLPYLEDLGVTVIYLNPIFEAASNHRYDTGDYLNVDPLLGGNAAFESLARACKARGIRIILDGVFNHTGCDSLYFNKYGNYGEGGAYNSERSPYRLWYNFDDSKIGYESWWGVSDLPACNGENPAYRSFIYGKSDSVVRRWLAAGASGWRLDVADELSDDFIEGIREAADETLPGEALIIGEVWEDASNKTAYGVRRRYFCGNELDGVMNYVWRDAMLAFVLGRASASELHESLAGLLENYPPENLAASLNIAGSHDKPRLLSLLKEAGPELALRRLELLLTLQFTLPGVPCIYYGDEAGLTGGADPENRAAYPWGEEDPEIMSLYRKAVALRKSRRAFTDGGFRLLPPCGAGLCYERYDDNETLRICVDNEMLSVRVSEIKGEVHVRDIFNENELE